MTPVVLRNPRIGFLNFDPEFVSLLSEDQKALAPLLKDVGTPSLANTCHVLFVYGKTNPDGTIQNNVRPGEWLRSVMHLRDIVQRVRAYIVILANENSPDILKSGFPWDGRTKWGADILFVGNRNGEYFQKFFRNLFSLMFQGNPMGLAFVQLNPQGPHQGNDVPGTMWPMRYGCWTFENSISEKPKIEAALMEELATGYNKDFAWHTQLADLILKKIVGLDGNEADFHIETALSRLGALSGIGCQQAVALAVKAGRIKLDQGRYPMALLITTTKDGGRYWFGDLPNQFLLETRMSVWSIIAYTCHITGLPIPDMHEVAGYVARSIGTGDFGKIRVANDHQPKESPIETLRRWGKEVFGMIASYGDDPMYLGWHFAIAGQKLILASKNKLSPAIGAQIFLESAVAMAKVDRDCPVFGLA